MNTRPINEPKAAALDAVKDYIYSLEEIGSWMGLSREELCYAKGTAEELLNLLIRSRTLPPLLVLEKFQMRMYDAYHRNPKNKVFEVAFDVVENIIESLTS